MKYGSVCSGIEAASVAWESLGWQAQWYSEIEHFPSAVLAHRFPTVPNLGDMTQIHNSEHFNGNSIDILVGGTPCQSFSVAGLRKGLDDTRGQLMLTFCELAARKRPRWVVWENVPGVLSSNKGEDLASFLGLLTGREIHPPVGGWKNSGVVEGIGSAYGVAWTVLDAQHFGVAQRRRRIFAVGYLGDWRPAAAVLFEHYRLSGDIKEGRKKRKTTSSDAQGSFGGGGNTIAMAHGQANAEITLNDTCPTISCVHESPIITHHTHAFKVRGGSETETGEQGGTPGKKAGKGYLGSDELEFTIGTTQDQQIAQPIAIQGNLIGRTEGGPQGIGVSQEGNMYTLTKADVHGVATPVPFRKARRAQSKDDYETWEQDEKTNTLNAFDTGDIRTTQAVVHSPIVYENHPSDSRVKEMGETCSTVTSKYGTGGGNTPLVAQPIAVDCYNQTINEHTSQTIGSSASDVNHYGAVLTPKPPTIIDRAAFNQGQNAQYDIKIEEGETMPSLVARGPHGVAYANILEGNPFIDTFVNKGLNHAGTQERNSVKVLSILREKIGTKAFAQWGLGVFNTLQSTQILQSDLHGIDVRPATFSDSRFIYGSLSCKENGSAWLMQSLREAGCEGCASQGWELSEQYIGELRAYLSELPYERPQSKRLLHDLWEADERVGILRQALSKIQDSRKSFVGESESTQRPYAIRRLTPFETEILQGFPRGWTRIPYRNKPAEQCPDGPRYKACGNSMAVPVMRWIGQRIQMVEDVMQELHKQ